MVYRSNCLSSGEILFSKSLVYVDSVVPLADMLAPGFFPKSLRIERHSLAFLTGSDGWVMAQCTGHDAVGAAILEQAQLVSTAPATDTLKPNRKAA